MRRLAALLAALLVSSAAAQACVVESEPNDTPAEAVEMGGRLCLAGDLIEDAQDAYWWTVDEEASRTPWRIRIEGISGRLTQIDLVKITFADDGVGVLSADTLMQYGTTDGRSRTSDPFLVGPGRYLLGISKSGGEGEYVVHLDPDEDALRRHGELTPEAAAENAFAYAGTLADAAEIVWTLSEEDAGYRWGLTVRDGLEDRVSATLEGPDGEVVSGRTDGGRVAFHALALQAGEYRLRLAGPAGIVAVEAVREGRLTDGGEVEPNDGWDGANVLRLDAPLSGHADGRDRFLLEIPDERAGEAWTLTVESEDVIEVTLYDGDREPITSRRSAGVRLSDLVLDADVYGLEIGRGEEGPYTIRLEPGVAPEEGFEHEPNDTLAGAAPLTEDLTVRGELDGDGDDDTFRFRVEGEPQLWRLQVIGDGVEAVRRYNGGGVREQDVRGDGRVRLDNVQLLPGEHYVAVAGSGGAYALRLLPLGPAPEPPPANAAAAEGELEPAAADPEPPETAAAADAAPAPPAQPAGPPPPPGRLEREPNDDAVRAERIRAGDVRVGTLGHAGDRDRYRFFLANDAYVELEAVPPEGGAMELTLAGAGEVATPAPGEPARIVHRLAAGDHVLYVDDRDGATGYYQLRLRLLDPLALPADVEPNHRDALVPLPASLSWTSRPGDTGTEDAYRLPRFDRPTEATLTVTHPDGMLPDVALLTDEGEAPDLERVEEGSYRFTLPAGREVHLRLRARRGAPYGAEMTFDAEPPPGSLRPDPNAGAADVTIDAEATDVTAYWHEGQRVPATVTVRNAGDAAATLALRAHVSDAAAEVELPSEVRLQAGETAEVPLVVRLPHDLRDDAPIGVTVAARGEGSIDTDTLTLRPLCDAAPVGAHRFWSVPDPMLGGIDVLSPMWGATTSGDVGGRVEELFDGITSPSTGAYFAAGDAVTVELPGDAPVLLTGALLHPQSRGGTRQQVRHFRIETSPDGAAYETAVEGRLEAARIEQAFPFDAPVRARYARLVLVDNHGGDRYLYLGAWKLVAAPEGGPGALGVEEVNLADPGHGGHVLWSRPNFGDGRPMLVRDDDMSRVWVERGERLSWAIGFQHGRAARVGELRWHDDEEGLPIPRVRIEVSRTGGAGPWQPVTEWTLEHGPGGASTLRLDEPVWARAIRFRTPIAEEDGYLHPPDDLEVLEAPPAANLPTILGEWGQYRREAAYEHVEAETDGAEAIPPGEDAGETMEAAFPLADGDALAGSVLVGEDVDWYRIDRAEGDTAVELRLRGDPIIAYDYALVDASGAPVPVETGGDDRETVLTAFPEEGQEVYLRLRELKRSVVFSWDSSGSVSSFADITYNSLAGFARDVDGDREAVQLLAFANPEPVWLLPYWSSDPERVQRGVNDYPRRDAASNAEHALLKATRALGDREGTRAVLLMTDAETTGQKLTPQLWEALEEVRPRVFTFEMSSGGSAWTQDLMQDWAAVNHGHYDYARNVSDFDIGWARAACHLRRAKRYELAVATRYEEPPGPGDLRVVRGGGATLPAVEVIFDASGSMGAPLPDGTPKIDAAKGVLKELVGEILPEEVPFALRAFGHLTPQSCESRLDLPLGPLDRAAAGAAIDAIQPKLLSQTPIADALAQVGDDLSSAGPSKTVVLITDGEESCGGDPEAALAALRDEGVDVRLSIVSLGVDDADARASFAELAASVDGSYAAADDTDALRASIEEALNPPYEVLDAAGEVVARGRLDGEPVSLPMGTYTVRVPGAPPTLLRDVRVPGDGATSVTFDGP